MLKHAITVILVGKNHGYSLLVPTLDDHTSTGIAAFGLIKETTFSYRFGVCLPQKQVGINERPIIPQSPLWTRVWAKMRRPSNLTCCHSLTRRWRLFERREILWTLMLRFPNFKNVLINVILPKLLRCWSSLVVYFIEPSFIYRLLSRLPNASIFAA